MQLLGLLPEVIVDVVVAKDLLIHQQLHAFKVVNNFLLNLLFREIAR